ncbi:MAG: hypothetical protein VXZ72_05350, partial [Chlamydiota bacterium]|nr:hypothetical protein [Chlamydiota bacterium]
MSKKNSVWGWMLGTLILFSGSLRAEDRRDAQLDLMAHVYPDLHIEWSSGSHISAEFYPGAMPDE